MDRPFEATPSIPRQSHRPRDSKEGGFLNAIRNMNGWVRAAVAALGLLGIAETGCAHVSLEQKRINACRVIDHIAEDNKVTFVVTLTSGGYNSYSYKETAEAQVLFGREAVVTNAWGIVGNGDGRNPETACKKNQQKFLPDFQRIASLCQDISKKAHAFELLGVAAETCSDFDGAENYYRTGLNLIAQDSSPQTIPIRHQLQRSLIRVANIKSKPACEKIREGDDPDMYGRFPDNRSKTLNDNVEKCGDDFLKLEAYANLGEGYEETDPFLAEKYYREALKVADGLTEKLGGFNYAGFRGDTISWQHIDPVYSSSLNVRERDAKAYRLYLGKTKNGLQKLAKLSDEEKRRIAEKYTASRMKGITFFRAGEDPTRSGAGVEAGAGMLVDEGVVLAPSAMKLFDAVVGAVEKMDATPGSQTAATPSPSGGEIEVETSATGYLSMPCTDTRSATRVGERQSKTCATFGEPACVIQDLAPGKYLVRAERSGGCKKIKAGPVEVEVKPGEKTKVDFSRKFAR